MKTHTHTHTHTHTKEKKTPKMEKGEIFKKALKKEKN